MSDASVPLIPTPSNADDAHAILIVSGITSLLVIVSVVLRFYVRISFRQGVKLDDWVILFSTVWLLVIAVLMMWWYAIAAYGVWRIEPGPDGTYAPTEADNEKIVLYLKVLVTLGIMYFTSASTTKLAILLLYKRIFSQDKTLRWQLWSVGAFVMAFWISTTVASMTNCVPLKWNWINYGVDAKHCFNHNYFWTSAGSIEVFIDLLLLLLPLGALNRVHLTYHQKISAGGIFVLGGFGLITGILRVALGHDPNSRVSKHYDIAIWTALHSGVSLMCATLPILNPLVRRIRKSEFVISIFHSCPRSKSEGLFTQSYNTRSAPSSGSQTEGLTAGTQPDNKITCQVSVEVIRSPGEDVEMTSQTWGREAWRGPGAV